MKRFWFGLFVFAMLSATLIYAKAPFIEMYYSNHPGESCLDRGKVSLEKSGFKMKSGTYSGEDVVGYQGEFKGAVSCIKKYNVVTFVVAGPDFKKVDALAHALQNNF